LVDKIGGLQEAVLCAARMSKQASYKVREYPEKKNVLEQLMDNYKKSVSASLIKSEIGANEYQMLQQVKQVRKMVGEPQSRMPFMLEQR
jgi:protease-4